MRSNILALMLAGVSGPVLAGAVETIAPESVMIEPPVAEVGFGGYATAYYGWFSAPSASTLDYNNDEAFNVYGGEVSFGRAGNGGFGWQADIMAEIGATAGDDDEYESYSGVLHGNFGVGAYTLGAFVGGSSTYYDHSSESLTGLWYGVEAARSFGKLAVAAQVGLSDVDSTHDPVDSQGQAFGNVEARYFINDGFAVSGNFGIATGQEHSNQVIQYQFGADAMLRLGQSNFYGLASYRGAAYTNDGDISGDVEQIVTLGVTMLFGGNSLQDTLTGSTPMLTTTAQMLMGLKANAFD